MLTEPPVILVVLIQVWKNLSVQSSTFSTIRPKLGGMLIRPSQSTGSSPLPTSRSRSRREKTCKVGARMVEGLIN